MIRGYPNQYAHTLSPSVTDTRKKLNQEIPNSRSLTNVYDPVVTEPSLINSKIFDRNFSPIGLQFGGVIPNQNEYLDRNLNTQEQQILASMRGKTGNKNIDGLDSPQRRPRYNQQGTLQTQPGLYYPQQAGYTQQGDYSQHGQVGYPQEGHPQQRKNPKQQALGYPQQELEHLQQQLGPANPYSLAGMGSGLGPTKAPGFPIMGLDTSGINGVPLSNSQGSNLTGMDFNVPSPFVIHPEQETFLPGQHGQQLLPGQPSLSPSQRVGQLGQFEQRDIIQIDDQLTPQEKLVLASLQAKQAGLQTRQTPLYHVQPEEEVPSFGNLYTQLYRKLMRAKKTFALSRIETSNKILINKSDDAGICKQLSRSYVLQNIPLLIYQNNINIKWMYDRITQADGSFILVNPDVSQTDKGYLVIRCNRKYSIIFDKFKEVKTKTKTKHSSLLNQIFVLPSMDITTKVKPDRDQILITSLVSTFKHNKNGKQPNGENTIVIQPTTSYQLIDNNGNLVAFGIIYF